MADSLSPECTPLKKQYDSCFNKWLEGYLEPALATTAPEAERLVYQKAKAEEYQRDCGALWDSYRGCVQKALKEQGLEDLLAQSRKQDDLAPSSFREP